MTYKLSVEALGHLGAEGFAKLVTDRIATLKEYDEHEAIVRQHATADMPAEESWVSLAVPIVPPELDAAIKRTPREDGTTEFTPDYEIVGPSFEVRKARLFDAVSTAEREAIAAVAPAGKLRAWQFREQDIRAADQERYAVEMTTAVEPVDFLHFSITYRPAADTKFLEEQAAREDQRQEIMRWAAGLHSDIEDLTPETIDAWELKPFNG